MLRIAVTKFLRALLTLAVCVTMVFVVLRVSGDPASALLPDDTPPDVVAEYHRRWGLDRPLHEQYLRYAVAVASGDLGISFADGRPAIIVVAERAMATVQLGLAALVLAILFGLPLGIVAALKRNTGFDRLLMSVAVFGFSIPSFFLGIVLILIFAMQARLLPSAGSETPAHLVLPALTLAAAALGKLSRFTRTAVLDVLGQPYVRTAKAKGLGQVAVIARHVMPNAAIPVVTFLGFELGLLIGGAVVVETVFAWPGIGRLLVISVGQRDLAVVQTIILLIALTMVLANLAVDLAYGWLDPRVKALAAGTGAK